MRKSVHLVGYFLVYVKVFTMKCVNTSLHPQTWKTTPCRLSATASSIYPQLLSISGGLLLHVACNTQAISCRLDVFVSNLCDRRTAEKHATPFIPLFLIHSMHTFNND